MVHASCSAWGLGGENARYERTVKICTDRKPNTVFEVGARDASLNWQGQAAVQDSRDFVSPDNRDPIFMISELANNGRERTETNK